MPLRNNSVSQLFDLQSDDGRAAGHSTLLPDDAWLSALLTIVTRATLCASAFISCHHVSVRLSQVGVLLKRLNVGSRKQRRTTAQGL